MQMLENRIRLLEFEEKKSQKKILETKKQTEKLKEIRVRNEKSEKARDYVIV